MSARSGWETVKRRQAEWPLFCDLALIGIAVVALLVLLATRSTTGGHGVGIADATGAIGAISVVALGHRAGLLAVGIAAPAMAVLVAEGGQRELLLAAVVLVLYRVASRTGRRTAAVAAATTIVLYGVSIAALEGLVFDRDFDIAIWSVLAVAIGDAVRSRRAYRIEAAERARRAAESRDEATRRRIVEERLRIARDLHDLVAHRMAVISVQAGVASHLLHARPAQAEEALRIVRASASDVLDELGGMLSVLRNVDDPEAPMEPTPALRDLGALVESFAAAGLEVSWTPAATPATLSDAVQLALYRLAQEGLTNAQRYGDGRASLRVESAADAVEVTIENRIAVPPVGAGRSGYGLRGMQERVAAAGGALRFGPTPDGWFRVSAKVPVTGRTAR